jgi:hypothetical protein
MLKVVAHLVVFGLIAARKMIRACTLLIGRLVMYATAGKQLKNVTLISARTIVALQRHAEAM